MAGEPLGSRKPHVTGMLLDGTVKATNTNITARESQYADLQITNRLGITVLTI
jgi:hypothetical protein